MSALAPPLKVPPELLQRLRENLADAESILETIEILNDPEAMKGIEEAREDIKHGRVVTFNNVEELRKYIEGSRDAVPA